MKCNKKISAKIPTDERCNEMIDIFDKEISEKFEMEHKYSDKERAELIKIIKANPTNFWRVTENGLVRYEM